MEQRDYYNDLKYCSKCDKYVSSLMGMEHSYCIECGNRVRLFSETDWVAFNDEGGFVPSDSGPPPYPAGVPYMVIGRSSGATMDSFIRNGGTNNGTSISESDRTYHDGFASNKDEELMLQSTLATGADASDSCPGGTKSAYKGPTSGYNQKPAPPLRVGPQTDGINHRRIVSIAIYCHQSSGCAGALTLAQPGKGHRAAVVRTAFKIPGGKTSHVAVRLPAGLVALARHRRPRGLPLAVTASTGSTTVARTIDVRIF